MTGWQWCPGARDQCRVCRRFVVGVWRYFVNDTTSTVSICADCAGGEGS